MINFFKKKFDRKSHDPSFGLLEVLKYIGPGLLITIGFIDPGNWTSNIIAGANFGYALLWMVTLSTIMLIVLQHNVARLGIATGLCLSEATTLYLPRTLSRGILSTAMIATTSTALAEILGAAIALNMIFSLPIKIGAILSAIMVITLLTTNSYRKVEKWIIGCISLIGASFIYELWLVDIEWNEAVKGWLMPSIPDNSIIIIMCILGAMVMPHNLFLHSEVIQSRQWNLHDDKVIKRQLDFEMYDTMFSMIIGWVINSAMILLAAATFFKQGTQVNELQQAKEMLTPLLGSSASIIFAIALFTAGIASLITSSMAGGSIFAGIFNEPFDFKDNHSRLGVVILLVAAIGVILIISNPFKTLIVSQMVLSIQLPITVFTQIYLTSSKKVMGKYANSLPINITLVILAAIITLLNILLFISFFK